MRLLFPELSQNEITPLPVYVIVPGDKGAVRHDFADIMEGCEFLRSVPVGSLFRARDGMLLQVRVKTKRQSGPDRREREQ